MNLDGISSSTAPVPMAWPPSEIVMQAAGGKLTVKQLFDSLVQYVDQRRGQIRAFKWWQARGEWTEINPDPSLETHQSPRRTRTKGRPKVAGRSASIQLLL